MSDNPFNVDDAVVVTSKINDDTYEGVVLTVKGNQVLVKRDGDGITYWVETPWVKVKPAIFDSEPTVEAPIIKEVARTEESVTVEAANTGFVASDALSGQKSKRGKAVSDDSNPQG